MAIVKELLRVDALIIPLVRILVNINLRKLSNIQQSEGFDCILSLWTRVNTLANEFLITISAPFCNHVCLDL